MGAVSLLKRELCVEVCLQHGVRQSVQDSGVDSLLVALALVGDRGGLPRGKQKGTWDKSTNEGTRLKPRKKRPLSVEHRHVGGTGEGAYNYRI